jgi:hypothetical protein
MGRTPEQYEAWIIGTHEMPSVPVAGQVGEVVVHNVTRDWWEVMPQARFDRVYQWVNET